MQDAGSNGTVAAGSQCISLWHSEKFPISLGLRNWEFSLSLVNFARLAKFTVLSENFHFRYLL